MEVREIVSSGNQIVDAIGQLKYTGNLIPNSWYGKITLQSGRTDLVAIVILAELVYWYRPAESRDPVTEMVMWKKKFRKDFLQKSIRELADKFSLTYEQVKHALNRLEHSGYIIKHRRNEIINGKKFGNVLYIELVPERLSELMCEEVVEEQYEKERCILMLDDPQDIDTGGSMYGNQRVSETKPEAEGVEILTNTKNRTKSNIKDYSSIIQERERFREQINYDSLMMDHPSKKVQIDEIVDTATEVLTSSKCTLKVDGEERPIEFIRERYRKLNISHIKYLLESLADHTNGITNVAGFIRTSLFKAPVTMDTHYEALVNHDLAVCKE